jgi:hypothetical protein
LIELNYHFLGFLPQVRENVRSLRKGTDGRELKRPTAGSGRNKFSYLAQKLMGAIGPGRANTRIFLVNARA